MLIAALLLSVAVSSTITVEYCETFYGNSKCVETCPSTIGFIQHDADFLCSTGICCEALPGVTQAPQDPNGGDLNRDPNTCGLSGSLRNKRSIGGMPTSRCKWPWLVSIRMENVELGIGMSHVMTGVLVSNRHVLVLNETFETLAAHATGIEAVVGDYYLNMNDDEHHVYKIDDTSKTPLGDFVLLDLGSDVPLDGNCVRPVCLSNQEEIGSVNMSQCKMVGWGDTDSGTERLTLAPVPLEVPILIEDDTVCSAILKFAPDRPNSTAAICLDSDHFVSVTERERGNPIICPNGNQQWHLKGMIARGNYDPIQMAQSFFPIGIDVIGSVDEIRTKISETM